MFLQCASHIVEQFPHVIVVIFDQFYNYDYDKKLMHKCKYKYYLLVTILTRHIK